MQTKLICTAVCMSVFLQAETTTVDCELVSSEEYMRVGDVDNKEIFLKTDFLYECNTTTVKKGPCEKWESQEEDYNASYRQDVTFKTENFEGSSAEMFNLISAYNGVQYIWGGWKGICTDGVLADFSWAQDPFYWASLVTQTVSGMDIAQGEIAQYAMCTAQAAIGMGDALMNYNDDSEIPCDPVDEFCGENDADSPDNVVSMDIQSWNDALAGNPRLADYTEVVSNDGNIVVVRFSPQDTTGMSDVDKSAADKEAKEMMLTFKAIAVGVNAAVCVGKSALGMGGGATSSVSGGASLTSAANIATTVIGTINPIVGAVLKIAIDIASSFEDVNSCHDKGDAEELGSRHLKTFTHKEYNLCHLTRIEEDIESSIFTDYDNYHYCCYPDFIAKTLTEQIKAQLARDWSHCTDITFKDLEKVSFRACSKEEISAPGTVDGKTIGYGASVSERERAFQFQYKCLDYTDLNNHIRNKIGGIDNFKFEEQLRGLQENHFELEETP